MARILIVGGGCRGRRFAERMVEQGHAVRATTRREGRRAAIESTGAECWIGTPERLATLRGALENVTIACWMLACARAGEHELAALHGSRLEFFLGQAIDTTARGLIYDAWPVGEPQSDDRAESPGVDARRPAPDLLVAGARIFRSLTELNAIPAVVLGGVEETGRARVRHREGVTGEIVDDGTWLAAAEEAVAALLDGRR